MSDERLIFEARFKEFKDGANDAIEIVNNTVDLFNSYGFPFCIKDKETLSRKCGEGFIRKSIEAKLNKAKCRNAKDGCLEKIVYRYGLIEKILTEPARKAREVLKKYGRAIKYDSVKLCFMIDRDKLESDAIKYAEYMEQ